MKYKKQIFAIGLLGFASTSHADFEGRIYTGFSDYSIENSSKDLNQNILSGSSIRVSRTYSFSSTPSEQPDEVTDTLPIFGVGGTFIGETYFFDGYWQTAFTGEFDDDSTFAFVNESMNYSSNDFVIQNGDIERYDWSLAVGRTFLENRNLALSVGYKGGRTKFAQDYTWFANRWETAYDFDTNGAFINLSYGGIPFVGGYIGGSIALARLSGDYTFSDTQLEGGTLVFEGNADGDATGLTFGVNWSRPITDSLTLTLSADRYSYDYDLEGDSDSNDSVEFSDSESENLITEFSETSTMFKIAISRSF